MALVRVVGAGPAGSSAALAALAAGADVEIFEKSAFPRHKVCGEFLSPEAARLIEELGLMERFLDLRPSRLEKMMLVFDGRARTALFPEPAFGLSRFALDHLLLDEAVRRGARLHQQSTQDGDVIAVGRQDASPKGRRLFGFKAHFSGPVNNVMELYFLPGYSYVGVSAIENAYTNVCGLAPEDELAAIHFDIDTYVMRHEFLARRLQSLRQVMPWMKVGPLVFGNRLEIPASAGYLAGDRLSFTDPFTGSGILTALLTGSLAGNAAALRLDPAEHLLNCRRRLRGSLQTAAFLRRALASRFGRTVAGYVPPKLLFQMTRPRI